MASRAQLTPIGRNRTVQPEDVNIIYYILNGYYSNPRGSGTETASRGLGMPIRLTGFDGKMPTGLLDTTSYALDVRNRETTQQRALAVRRADNQIAFNVTGGKAYAQFNGGASVLTQVLVNGSAAGSGASNPPGFLPPTPITGGVLRGTYPDPDFYLSAESYVIRPKTIQMWCGSNATVLVAGNQELQDAPGWVLCAGQTVTMRDGSTFVVPNLNDKYPIGAGGTYALGATAGNALATQQAVSISHNHNMAHTHSHDHAHEHTVPNHAHSHSHAATSAGVGLTVPNHQHAASSGGVGLTMPQHTHTLNNHSHTGNTLARNHKHAHSHDLDEHDHGSGTYKTATGAQTTKETSGERQVVEDGTGVTVTGQEHDHGVGDIDIYGNSNSGQLVGTDNSFTSTKSADNSTQVSWWESAWTGTSSTPRSADGLSAANSTDSGSTALITGSTANDGTALVTGSTANALTTDTTGTVSTTSKTASVDATASSATNTGTPSITAINAQPPTIALWFIMKL